MRVSEVLWDLFDLAITGAAGVARRLALMRVPKPESPPSADISEDIWARVQAGEIYVEALRRLALMFLSFPLPILAIGLAAGLGWLVAVVGIFWAICTIFLLIVATPLGMLLESVLGGIKGIGTKYINASLMILLGELLFTLFASVVPLRNNPSAIPIVIIASATLAVLSAMGVKTPFSQRFMALIVSGIFLLFTFSFFLPRTFDSVMNWAGQLDANLTGNETAPKSSRGGPGMPPGGLMETEKEIKEYEAAVKQAEAKRRGSQTLSAQAEGQTSQSDHENTPSRETMPYPAKVRLISGTAYSYSKDSWAVVDPVFGRFHGNGRYPYAYLLFWSGLVAGAASIEWNGSYTIQENQLRISATKLKVGDSPVLPDFYADVGIGFDVLLENAVFADYTMAKTVMVFRTFAGDSPPPRIDKSYEIMRVEPRQEQPYLISGEWTGSYGSDIQSGSTGKTNFVARFIQNGNKFEGVILDTDTPMGKLRSRVEGLIVDGRVTFVKTYKGQVIGVSCVATYVRGVESLEGSWYQAMQRGRWSMTRRGEFEGSVDDILSADAKNP